MQLRSEIDKSLVSMEGRHGAIKEALGKPKDEVGLMIQERAERVLAQKPSQPEGE